MLSYKVAQIVKAPAAFVLGMKVAAFKYCYLWVTMYRMLPREAASGVIIRVE